MFSQSLTVPEAVRTILSTNRIYKQALELGIVNYTALASKIKSDVEGLTGSIANINTIVVAIKRLSDSAEKKRKQQENTKSSSSTSSSKAKLSLTGSILDVGFERENDRAIAEVLDRFFQDSVGYNLFQSENHYTLLTEDAKGIRGTIANILDKVDGTISEGLSKITISLAPGEQDPYEALSLVLGTLHGNQIPVRSAFFSANDITLILRDKDAARAYDLIRMEI